MKQLLQFLAMGEGMMQPAKYEEVDTNTAYVGYCSHGCSGTSDNKVPANLDRFDVAFFDSVNTLGLEPEQLRKLPKSLAFVFVFQTTKEGLFRGSQEFSHDVDTVIKVDNMKAVSEKNRYGGKKEEVQVC